MVDDCFHALNKPHHSDEELRQTIRYVVHQYFSPDQRKKDFKQAVHASNIETALLQSWLKSKQTKCNQNLLRKKIVKNLFMYRTAPSDLLVDTLTGHAFELCFLWQFQQQVHKHQKSAFDESSLGFRIATNDLLDEMSTANNSFESQALLRSRIKMISCGLRLDNSVSPRLLVDSHANAIEFLRRENEKN